MQWRKYWFYFFVDISRINLGYQQKHLYLNKQLA